MKATAISQLKQELALLSQKETAALCLRLAKCKKDNKELLAYLLFAAHDVPGYLETIRLDVDEQFELLPRNNLYFFKKGLRKILRDIAKYGRHVGTKEALTEMLLHFCSNMKRSGIPFQKHTALNKLYITQIKKLQSLIEEIHEDLQYDYRKKLELL